MKKFVITGKFEGAIYMWYNEAGFCFKIHIPEVLNEKQLRYIFTNLPVAISGLQAFADKAKLKVIEQVEEIDFDDFYAAFGNKTGKVLAKKSWDRLTPADQVKAFLYIPRYKTYLKQNTWQVQLMPATYLNQKRWED